MNYKVHYEKLISKAQNRSILKSEYKENHHIIPTCMGGSDDKINRVDLFPEEHIIAHLLLVKIHSANSGLIHAANMMTNGSANKKQKRKVNNKKYGWIRKKHSDYMKINNPMFLDINKKIHSDKMKKFNETYVATDETNKKIASTVKLGWKNDENRRNAMSKRNIGIRNNRFDSNLYEFNHPDGRHIICFQNELHKIYECDKVSALINGKRKSCKGWKYTGRRFKRIEI